MDSIATDIFKIKAPTICRTMFMLYGKPWAIGGVVLLAIAIFLGIFLDLRWVIVALMLVFIVTPMLLAFLFFYYGMNPVSVINTPPHQLEFCDSGIKASIFTKETIYTPETEGTDDDNPTDSNQKDNKYEKRSESLIPYSSINGYIVGTSCVILLTTCSGKGFLLLPLKVFNDKNSFIHAINMVAEGMKKHINNNRKYENS